jgi:hypothetical protein
MMNVALVVWAPYVGSDSVFLLSAILVIVGVGLIFLGRRMRRDVKLPRMMGRVSGAVVVVIWAISILVFLRVNRALARYSGSAATLGPIFPITLVSAICSFVFVAYATRRNGVLSALGNGFLAFVAGPMVFEFPFLLIVIPRVSAPLIPALIFLLPLFAIIFTTLSMLFFFSRSVAITKNSVFLYAAMIFVFAIWALDGYSYPSNEVSFALNAISKVLGFASVAAMFHPTKKKPQVSYSYVLTAGRGKKQDEENAII